MSIEEAILEHAAAVRELAAAVRLTKAAPAAQPPAPAVQPAEPEAPKADAKPAAARRLRTTKVTDADIDKAAAETKAAAEAKAKAAAAEKAQDDLPADEEESAEDGVDFEKLREQTRDLIHEIVRTKGRPAALAVLAPAARLSDIPDVKIPEVLDKAKAVAEEQEEALA